MTHSAKTFRLNEKWDIVTKGGQFPILVGAEAVAQNVANEIKLFTDDAWIARDEGTPWFDIQLGEPVRRAAVVDALRRCASRVDGVESVESVELLEFDDVNRVLRASLSVTIEGRKYAFTV